jgi:CBS domain-containing protein
MATMEVVAAELTGTVGEVMSKQVVAVLPNVSSVEAAEQLSATGVRHAIVVDFDRHVLGVVSQRDIFTHFIETLGEQGSGASVNSDCNPWEIGSLIRATPITVDADALLSNAGLVLANYKIDCLPVVDQNKALIGSLSITELLRYITEKLDGDPEGEEEFTFFKPDTKSRPQTPAFFRRANGALVIPINSLEDPNCVPDYAVLGYEPNGGRIAVKFVADKKEEGARKVGRDNGNLVIPASDFVARFDIKSHVSAFDVTKHRKLNCLVLTPKQTTPGQPQAAVAVEVKK